MAKTLPVMVFAFCISMSSTAQNRIQNSKFASQKFCADTVKQTLDDLTLELSLKHPGFYRYTTKADFDNFIDSLKKTVRDSLTEMEAFLKFKSIITKIHCLHSGVSLPAEYRDFLNERPNLFPFQLFFSGQRAFVVRNYSSDTSILAGQEILAINGRSIALITAQLLTLIPSDGFNLTMKYRALYLQFPSWYRSIDPGSQFSIVVKQDNNERTCKVNAAKFNDIVHDGFLREPVRDKQLEFRIENHTGFLNIHTFSQSEIKKGKQVFREFIDQSFAEMKTKRIKELVVDLRDNTGGSDPNAAYFTSYFFDQPFHYWNRIEVTEAIAKEIKGLALKLFYRKPLRKDSIWLWQKARHVRDFDFYEIQNPARNNFKGHTYVLINGFCMSSCADVAAILSSNKKAVFIGQETGGGYQGNNSGMIPESKIEPFGFIVTVPLQKYVNQVDATLNIGRGTMPDQQVEYTIEDILSGDDKEMDLVFSLIKDHLD